MDDFLWDREVADFVDTLRKAGFGSFVYTNQSTAVMENLHQFAVQGCGMEGLCMITRREMAADIVNDIIGGAERLLASASALLK